MDMNLILASIGVFLVVVLLLVVILLVAKKFLVPSGNVKLTINGERGTGGRLRLYFAQHPVGEWGLSLLGLWRKRLVRTMQVSSAGRGRRDFAFRTASLQPQADTGALGGLVAR